jgi:hypothetical protein
LATHMNSRLDTHGNKYFEVEEVNTAEGPPHFAAAVVGTLQVPS